jgi:hypothetical protein
MESTTAPTKRFVTGRASANFPLFYTFQVRFEAASVTLLYAVSVKACEF